MATSPEDVKIFGIDQLLHCNNIQLSAWCQNGCIQILALYLKSNELLLCLLTETQPVLRRILWYKNEIHTPVSLAFSPAGTFLLVLSKACHLYTVPAMSMLDPFFKLDVLLNPNEITFYMYPFKSKLQPRRTGCANDIYLSESKWGEHSSKLAEHVGSVVTWYQTIEHGQHIGILATRSGEIVLVDLLTCISLAKTSVIGCVTDLALSNDDWSGSVSLLITTINQQYELLLDNGTFWKSDQSKNKAGGGSSADDTDDEPPKIHRGRLHGFKQMSVEKLQSIKLILAETRARAQVKTPNEDTGVKSFLTEAPKPLEASHKDSKFSRQYFKGRYVVASFHPPSQLLSLYSTLAQDNPWFVHKMPSDCHHCVVSDCAIYAVTNDLKRVLIVSSLLSESPLQRSSEFNPDCILGQFDVHNNEDETVIAIYKGSSINFALDVPDSWQVDTFKKMIDEGGGSEPCIIVTNQRLLRISLTDHVVCTALRLVLDKNYLVQAERICKIFKINLAKLLELAGDINLACLNIPRAINHFKLATCQPLKITVKLAKLGHCSELLSYSTALLMRANTLLNLVDYMHISNLLLMAFVHQILSGAGAHLKRKYLTFLESNDWFDKGLSVKLSGQSLIFPAVHKLITSRGLIYDGLAVLGSIIKSVGENPCLLVVTQDDEFWTCLSEPLLQEAYVHRPDLFRCFSTFISSHLPQISTQILDRLCRALDITTPYLRPHIRMVDSEEETEDKFPIRELIQLYLTVLLVRVSKDQLEYDSSLMIPFDDAKEAEEYAADSTFDDDSEVFADSGFRIGRRNRKAMRRDECETRLLSCGFGHSALIRDGAIFTWGLNNKGCLGHGPSLARNLIPEPITMFGTFRIQVSQVSCGRAHTAALTNNGVYTWGSSSLGQLGLGSEVLECPHPRLVSSLSSHRVVLVVCGQYHTMCLTHAGQLLGFGWNVHGQLGLGTIDNVKTPVLIHTLNNYVISNVACGHGHTLALSDTGHLFSFGSSLFGQLGYGSTQKRSLPVLVRPIFGKITLIATGYFHNLALTAENKLYAWGASPQVLRLQGQASKRARAMRMQPADSPDAQQVHVEVADSEAHLTPALVDTGNVSGQITQIACGCHHYALTTETGSVYTWGRSMDGQLGNGARTEVVLPTLITDGSLKASSIALGCDFSVIVEKLSGKVYAWGSNGSRQIGIAIKQSSARDSEGKVVVVKKVKRVVRLPNSVANVVDQPVEVPFIPSATFTYQPLISTVPKPTPPPTRAYTQQLWHSTLYTYSHLVNHDLLLCKCLELGNHQTTSKVLLLRGQYRQAVVYQLKAVQKAQKERTRMRHPDLVNGNDGLKLVQTPDSEMHPFTVQGGVEGMCDMVDNPRRHDNGLDSNPLHTSLTALDTSVNQYCSSALEILLKFLIFAPAENAAEILETGIQFWSAEKLPMDDLEAFLLEHMERVFYPLGTLLYLGKRELARHFTAELQLRVTTRLVEHVENNGSCEDFVSALSKLLSLGTTSVEDLSNKLQNPPQKLIHVSWPPCPGDTLYIFSCGHSTSSLVLPPDQSKLAETYARLDTEGFVDMACPECVCGLVSAEVA